MRRWFSTARIGKAGELFGRLHRSTGRLRLTRFRGMSSVVDGIGIQDPPGLEVRDDLLDEWRILLTCLLKPFCQLRNSVPSGFLKGVIMLLPTHPLPRRPILPGAI